MIDFDFKLPLEYESFKYLHVHLGDIGTVEAVLICKYLTSHPISINYEKTIMTIDIEV